MLSFLPIFRLQALAVESLWPAVTLKQIPSFPHTWSDNKVRELIAVDVVHNSLLNIIVVAFKQ
jgi:hypothetical protein